MNRYIIFESYPDTLYWISKETEAFYVLRTLLDVNGQWYWGSEFGFVEGEPMTVYKTIPKQFRQQAYEAFLHE